MGTHSLRLEQLNQLYNIDVLDSQISFLNLLSSTHYKSELILDIHFEEENLEKQEFLLIYGKNLRIHNDRVTK